MRKNLPITDSEQTFDSDEKLISSTDLKGTILHCNDAFVAISGYQREELIGQPHNIVRHPDMPQEAYRVMWEHLQAGRPWMGLVKNRCKNGDYYWVDAYITPVTEQGKVVGYESVRSCPRREDIARAEKLYRKLAVNNGKKQSKQPRLPRHSSALEAEHIIGLVISSVALISYLAGYTGPAAVLVLVATLTVAIGATGRQRHQSRMLLSMLSGAFQHPLAVQTYTDNPGNLGRLQVAILSEKSHLGAVLTRIDDAARHVAERSQSVLALSRASADEISRQQEETEQVAAAMNEMSATIADVAQNVQQTAAKAGDSNELAHAGQAIAITTRQAIETLSNTVNDISESVGDLSDQTDRIADAARIIEQIAEQTNLLALNAAIEAARAGEQGRGFAVVADEVRNLAQRTQTSTRDIHGIIEQLTSKATLAVKVAESGKADADKGLDQVKESETMLNGITDAVRSIAEMADQMAAAVEEQSQVAEDINQQVTTISSMADTTMNTADETSAGIEDLENTARDLSELVIRFKR